MCGSTGPANKVPTRRQNKMEPSKKPEHIVLDVLRAASPDVLGETVPLSVARPEAFSFSNAKGDLKSVDSFADIQRIGAASAASFKANIAKKN